MHAVGAKNVDGDDDGEVEDHGMGECADGTVADADDGDEEADAMGECGNVTVADVVCETDGMECDLVFLVDFLVLLLQVVAVLGVVFLCERLSHFHKNSVPTCKKNIAHLLIHWHAYQNNNNYNFIIKIKAIVHLDAYLQLMKFSFPIRCCFWEADLSKASVQLFGFQ